MKPPELLASLSADGLTLEADGDRIKAGPADRLNDAHRTLIRAHRAELVALLARKLHLMPPDQWPLDAARQELALLRRLRDELEAAGVPRCSLEFCDREIERFYRAVHVVEASP